MKSAFLALSAIATILVASCAPGSAGATAYSKPYTKDTCLVTGNKLGSMGTPVSYNHEGQEIKLCCRPCVAKFKADPQRYLSKL